jgi:hypothetical protein
LGSGPGSGSGPASGSASGSGSGSGWTEVPALDRLRLHLHPLLREDSVLEVDLSRADELRALAVLVPHLVRVRGTGRGRGRGRGRFRGRGRGRGSP